MTGAPGTVEPAGRVTFSTVVANIGGRRAGPSEVRYVLSRGGARPRVKDPRLVVLHRVAGLGAGQRRRARALVAIVPPTAKAGVYRLFACVAVRAPAEEGPASNNCRLARRVRVLGGSAVAVAPVRANDRAVSTVVGVEGGTVEASAPDGSVVRLVVPPGALTGSVVVRLVPLVRLDRFALSGASFLAGAEVEPAGILLARPAQLEVTPPPGTASAVLGFSYDPSGANLHLVPVLRRPRFAVLVDRFVGFAAASARLPSRAAARARLPAKPAYRVEQAIAKLQVAPSSRRVHAVPIRAAAAVGDILSEPEARLLAAAYYVDVIRPQLRSLSAASSLDPDVAIAAMRRLSSLISQLELIGIENPLPNAYAEEASDLMQQIVRKAFDERVRPSRRVVPEAPLPVGERDPTGVIEP